MGPTLNPIFSLRFKITLFNRNDLPVLYFPTKLIIPKLSLHFCDNNFFDSSDIINLPFSNVTKGIAVCLGGL